MGNNEISVLLVDDEVDLVDGLRKRLLRRGFNVIGVLDGPSALSVVEQRPIDVAVVDLKMPGMDGIELLQRLKIVRPMIQVIMLTGHGSIGSAHESGRLDSSRFMTKPADFETLVDSIVDAADTRRKELHERYVGELNQVVSSSRSPQEIVSEAMRLRAKYEQ